MTDVTTYTVRAEPLTEKAFAPFGQVIAAGDMVMELRGDEVFHLNVLHYDRRPLRCDHLKPTLLVVAPPEPDFASPGDLETVRAFVCDGWAGVNLALHVWHWGPYPLTDHVDLVNVQGRFFATDNEVAHLERDLGTVVEVLL